jgi:drug/metabolite transporter (DMT)-like permease
MRPTLSPRVAVALFAVVVLAWGTNWSVVQRIVESVPPLWTSAIRCWIAAAAMLPMLWARGTFVIPQRGDVPVVLSIALLHMSAFAALAAAGQQFIPASKAIVLGYTTPLWVAIGAPLLLREPLTRWHLVGIALSLGGIAIIFNPGSFDWSDRSSVVGSGLVMLGAVCWAASIIHVRFHQWIATPFQLLFWQVLVAALVLSGAALAIEGWPNFIWSPSLLSLFLYGGLVGTVAAYWAMSMVNRSLPAITTSLGVLLTPLVGIATAHWMLGEPVDASLVVAAVLVVGGIAFATLADGWSARESTSQTTTR